jgi:hypothetical protein
MPLTRELDSPLISEDDALRRAALLQLVTMPSLEGAKAIVEALVFFLKERPQVAGEFEHVLYNPPLAPLAEAPMLELLDEEDDAVREEAAFILYKMKIRASSRARLVEALSEDQSPWVRAYAAKALGMLSGGNASALLAEAIDNEAMPEIVARMGEALAMCGDPTVAEVLRDQAQQLRERKAPVDAPQPDLWIRTAGQVALLFDALAAKVADEAPDGASLLKLGEAWVFEHPALGKITLAGGLEQGGFAARVHTPTGVEALELDSPEARRALDSVAP